MRVCVVHSFYAGDQPSGENTVVETQVRALEHLGHDVTLLAARTDELGDRRGYVLESAARVATGRGASPLARIEQLQPDIVHVHNLFPNVGDRWLAACASPLVMTLHNFRPLCAAATLYRDGAACHECLDTGPQRAIVHGCYRGSRVATLPWWLGARRRRHDDPLLTSPDVLIALSEQARTIYEAAVPGKEVLVLPNPVEDNGMHQVEPPTEERWLYAGRLTAEKGVMDLLKAWPEGVPLDIAGDGPLADPVQAALPIAGRYLGRLSPTHLRALLPGYSGLVFPSHWPEGAPMIYVEALASALPTVALQGNSVAADVRARGTGIAVDELTPTTLRHATRTVLNHGTGLRSRCRAAYEARHTPHSWAEHLLDVYSQVRDRRSARRDVAQGRPAR